MQVAIIGIALAGVFLCQRSIAGGYCTALQQFGFCIKQVNRTTKNAELLTIQQGIDFSSFSDNSAI